MSPPEHFAAVADRILADILTGQPARNPRTQGDLVINFDAVLAEARRHHTAVCREYNPHATDDEIASYWDGLGPAGREGYLRTAERRLAGEAAQ